jgi:hypothetical protein
MIGGEGRIIIDERTVPAKIFYSLDGHHGKTPARRQRWLNEPGFLLIVIPAYAGIQLAAEPPGYPHTRV